jgi:Phosphotriesterase family
MIDTTPTALGRNPAALARISRATGIRVVATTGGHREAHYAPGHWLLELSSGELANRFTDDVQVGTPVRDAAGSAEVVANEAGLPVRAGVLKAGIGYWGWTAFERRCCPRSPTRTHEPAPQLWCTWSMAAPRSNCSRCWRVTKCDPRRCYSRTLTATPIPASTPSSPPAHTSAVTASPAPRHWPDSMLIDCLVRSAESDRPTDDRRRRGAEDPICVLWRAPGTGLRWPAGGAAAPAGRLLRFGRSRPGSQPAISALPPGQRTAGSARRCTACFVPLKRLNKVTEILPLGAVTTDPHVFARNPRVAD